MKSETQYQWAFFDFKGLHRKFSNTKITAQNHQQPALWHNLFLLFFYIYGISLLIIKQEI